MKKTIAQDKEYSLFEGTDIIFDTKISLEELNKKKVSKNRDIIKVKKIIDEISGYYVFYMSYFKYFKNEFSEELFIKCLSGLNFIYPNYSNIYYIINKLNAKEDLKTRGKTDIDLIKIKKSPKVFNLNDHKLFDIEKNVNTFLSLSLLYILRLHNNWDDNSLTDMQIYSIYLYLNDKTRNSEYHIENKKRIIKYLFKMADKTVIAYLINKGILIYDFIFPSNKHNKNKNNDNNNKLRTNKIIVKRKTKKDNEYVYMSGTTQSKIITYVPLNVNNSYIMIVDVWNNGYMIDIDNFKVYKIKEYHKLYHNI